MSATPLAGDFSHIGKSLRLQGEISGNEDLYIDGKMEGGIQLTGSNLTVGPNGRIEANVTARNVIVAGSLEGNIQAGDRTELRQTAVVNGDIKTRRIVIADGAFYKGKLEILSEGKSPFGASVATPLPSSLTPPPQPDKPGQNK